MRAETQERHDLATVVAAIRREYETLDRYLGALMPPAWQGGTACTEWTVQKTVSHLGSGAEIHLHTLRTNVDGAEPLANEVRQGIWDHFDSLDPERLHPEFRQRNEAYLGYLEGLSPEARTRRVRSFAGETSIAEYAQFRLSELSLHSWDIRVSLDPTARLLPTSARANFPHALDTLHRRANRDARAELAGAVYQFEVYGPVRHRFALAVRDDTIEVLEGEQRSAAASLRLPTEAFIRLYTGRLRLQDADEAGEVAVEGDRAAAERLHALFPGF